MELTNAQKHLIHGLKLFEVTEEEMVGIMLAMDTPEKRDALMCWMAENLKATPSEIIGKTMEIIVENNSMD